MIELRPNQERALTDMLKADVGQIVMTTGGGKTICMIMDAIRQFKDSDNKTIVVVSPRILLATQLSSEFLDLISESNVFHCHSGETRHDSSTDPLILAAWHHLNPGNKIIFTTYHSLHKVRQAEIEVDTIYFDEAHNSVKPKFFEVASYFSEAADRAYFLTATPRHSKNENNPGMQMKEVYGEILHHTSAPELVQGGFIVPPKVVPHVLPTYDDDEAAASKDCKSLIKCIDEYEIDKILVCAKSTAQIINLVRGSDFPNELAERGYSLMYITSKTGAVIDNKMVDRELFFDTLNKWGKDPDKKFIVMHYSILSEGINVSGLEGVIFMRGMNYTGVCQTIGRIVRMNVQDALNIKNGLIRAGDFNSYTKPFGLVVIPVYSDDEVYKSKIVKSVQAVVDMSFNKGQPVITQV